MKKFCLAIAVCFLFADANISEYNMASLPHMSPLQKIKLLDQKSIDIKKISGVKFAEISDLAYDREKQKLYMLSDEGKLFQFDAAFTDRSMTLTPISGHYLHKKNQKHLKHSESDSEGMSFDGKKRLWVSFEGNPRIAHIDTNGTVLKYADLPSSIPALKRLRGRNKSLESLTWHPRYGLITALEYPQKGVPLSHQTLYGMTGKRWGFIIRGIYHPGVTAIETMDDGNMLVLVRSVDKKHFRIVIALLKVYLNTGNKNSVCRSEILAKFSTDDGWALDNFEGLTRISPYRYLMVSDNGNDFFRKTLLIYFEIEQSTIPKVPIS
jgi:hypothetical protein